MKTNLSISSVTVYVTGLIIGSLFGVFSGIVSLVAIVFAVKLWKYNQKDSEKPPHNQTQSAVTAGL